MYKNKNEAVLVDRMILIKNPTTEQNHIEPMISSYMILHTRRNCRVLRSINVGTGRVKIDVIDVRMPFDSCIVNAWVMLENNIKWLFYEAGSASCIVKIPLMTAIRQLRQSD